MKKLVFSFLMLISLGISAQQHPLLFNYSSREELTLTDSFLIQKHRLYPTGLEYAEGKFFVRAGERWVDLDLLNREVVSTVANSQGLIDHWEVHDVNRIPEKHRIILKVRYLTVRWPYEYRAGKLGTIILEHNYEKILESITFFIADQGYTGMGETLYIYTFGQDVNGSDQPFERKHSELDTINSKAQEPEQFDASYYNERFSFCFNYPSGFFDDVIESDNSDGAKFISQEIEVYAYGFLNYSNTSLGNESLKILDEFQANGGIIIKKELNPDYFLFLGTDQNGFAYFKKVCMDEDSFKTLIIQFKKQEKCFEESRLDELLDMIVKMLVSFNVCN